MDEILPNLWLGKYPTVDHIPQLHSKGIKSILTVETIPLSPVEFHSFNVKFFRLEDDPTQDLLHFLDEALSFIDASLQQGGGILVHCRAGVSRSASLVIAFIMRRCHASYTNAYRLVSDKRDIFPNFGFINQLKLFELMRWQVDADSVHYQHYLKVRKHQGYNAVYNETVVPSHSSGADQHDKAVAMAYRCKRCRSMLFTSLQLATHCKPEQEPSLFADDQSTSCDQGVSGVLIKGVSLNDASQLCDANELFAEPLVWTNDQTHDIEGKLHCPKCKAKVGSYNWCGQQCTCGSWVTPAFHFHSSHIDRGLLIPTPRHPLVTPPTSKPPT